jgi:hypothetical protein
MLELHDRRIVGNSFGPKEGSLMDARRWSTGLSVLAVLLAIGCAPASAQYRPAPGPDMSPPGQEEEDEAPPPTRRGPPPAARPDYRGERPPGPPGPPPGRRDDLRARMLELRQACQDGDRRACVRFGILIGENRARRDQMRRENPDFFWYER